MSIFDIASKLFIKNPACRVSQCQFIQTDFMRFGSGRTFWSQLTGLIFQMYVTFRDIHQYTGWTPSLLFIYLNFVLSDTSFSSDRRDPVGSLPRF